jgi:hypothetical protein
MSSKKGRGDSVFGPFSAGDSLRVYRLQRRGVSLDLQRGQTQPTNPLREAWWAFLTQQAMGQPTYVYSDLRDGEGFIQVRYRPHQAAADVAFLAPSLEEGRQVATAWAHLLEGAAVEAARRGLQRIFANLPEAGAEVDVFHQSGFIFYAGEDIYRLDKLPATGQEAESLALRAQRPEDWPAFQKLCVAITPQRVRQAEGGIALAAGIERNCQRYVLPGRNGEDLAGVLNICSGGQSYWLRLMVHPDARDVADGLIRWALVNLTSRPDHPVYCNVRQYEGGVRVALEAAGFEPFVARALVVKHTVAWSKVAAPELAPVLKSSAEAAPPAYRINGERELQPPKGRLATARDT